MNKLIISLVLAAACASSSAGIIAPALLYNFHVFSNGWVVVYSFGARESPAPACGAVQNMRMAFDGTTAGGKLQVAGLLAAMMAGKPIGLRGTGACAPGSSDTETLDDEYAYFGNFNA